MGAHGGFDQLNRWFRKWPPGHRQIPDRLRKIKPGPASETFAIPWNKESASIFADGDKGFGLCWTSQIFLRKR